MTQDNQSDSDPSLDDLKERLAALPPEELAALLKKFPQKTDSESKQSSSKYFERLYPASLHQARLWIVEQIETDTPLYNMATAIRLQGDLNLDALKHALQVLLDRHEALRTTLHMENGQVMQRVNPPTRLEIPEEDLSELPGDILSILSQKLVKKNRKRYDLSSDLMIRPSLFKLGEQDHVLNISFHHANCDGWSQGILMRELNQLYRAFKSGQDAPTLPDPGRYVDFAEWQVANQNSAEVKESLQWWLDRLENAPNQLNFPTDHPRPRIGKGLACTVQRELSRDCIDTLSKLANEEYATLYMILNAAFFILLNRYTGSDDLLVGTVTAGRQMENTHEVVGFFVDTVVLRCDLSKDPSTRELVQQLQSNVLDAIEHGNVPFQQIVEALNVPRSLNHHPLFQALFNAPPIGALEFEGVQASPVYTGEGVAKFDLEMLYRDQSVPSVYLTGDRELFERRTLEQFLERYDTLLKSIAEDFDRPIRKLIITSSEEAKPVLETFNKTEQPYPKRCVHQLFEDQVLKQPATVAAIFDDKSITYEALNQQANQLAHLLIAQGVLPDTPVGIFLDASIESVVAVLGILKAGGAYLPLSTNFPKERLRRILEDADAKHIVSLSTIISDLPGTQAQIIRLDEDQAILGRQSVENPSPDLTLEHVVYLLYTSGSTGQPKGVQFLHRGGTNLVHWEIQDRAYKPGNRALLFSPLTFDPSFKDLFTTLCSGGTLVITSEAVRQDPERLSELLLEHAVERINLPYVALNALANAIVANPEHQEFPALKEITSTAEQLQISSALREWLSLNSHVILHNHYGPTETHVVTATTLAGQARDWPEIPTIGKPIANTQVLILDKHLALVPLGMEGDLYLAGDNLARGYLNLPEMTDERFVENPFQGTPNTRMYATGDAARWLPNGELEFLGRKDHQVKLRGYRIELGEIESNLQQHPNVAQGVVILVGNDADSQRLIAFCKLQGEECLDTADLKAHLAETLPAYMIPASFFMLEELPLTSSGKVDRKALLQHTGAEPVSEIKEPIQPPQTETESKVWEIWSAIFQSDQMGIHDNFFDLGGHSLLAIQIMARIRTDFKVRLPIRTLFESPTISELASALDQKISE